MQGTAWHWNAKFGLKLIWGAAKKLFEISIYVTLAMATVGLLQNHQAVHGLNEFMDGGLAFATLAGHRIAGLSTPWNIVTLIYIGSIPVYMLVSSIRRG